MARTYSHDPKPHRDLVRSKKDVQRGDDVKVLERHARDRLKARGVDVDHIGNDGILTYDEFNLIQTAGRLLGAREDTLDKKDSKGRAVLTVGVQNMIIHPETRTPEQQARAQERMDKLTAERKKREEAQAEAASSSNAGERAVAAFRLAFNHAPAVHYTQTAARWQGINNKLLASKGQYPNYADCSSMYTWAWWNALGADHADIINGLNWRAGYTGTLLTHGRAVSWSQRRPGDAVIYGNGFPGKHVAMIDINVSYVYSHGNEYAPTHPVWNYRSDIMQIRRYN